MKNLSGGQFGCKESNMLMEHGTQWSLFKEYINSSKIGDLITRKDMNKTIYKDPEVWKRYSRTTTLDGYRLSLSHLGILTVIMRGVYRVDHHINPDVTMSKIKELAYQNPTWKDWFIPEEVKVKHLITVGIIKDK
jgi:hypothetical protein